MSSTSEYNSKYYRKHGVRLRAEARERMSRYRTDPVYRAAIDARVKAYRQTPKGKEQRYDYHLRRKYGINMDDYRRMFDEQKGECLICKETKRRLVVDHCHTSGRVRGLICQHCNARLGWYETFKSKIEEYLCEYIP